MFTEMRRIDRELPPEEIMPILTKATYGVLSTIGANGYPYGVPISFVTIDETIYFHCAKNVGNKIDNIINNPKVSFTVIGDTETLPDKFSTKYESVIAFGEASEVSDKTKKIALNHIINKYSKDFKESGTKYIHVMLEKTAVYKIQVHHMTGKARK